MLYVLSPDFSLQLIKKKKKSCAVIIIIDVTLLLTILVAIQNKIGYLQKSRKKVTR